MTPGGTALVTGPSLGGLGYHTALELARRGARVVLAGRSPARLRDAADSLTREVPQADVELLTLDLASFASVRTAAKQAGRLGPLHLLVNNAGVMAPGHQRTEDGLELQMATNHYGPFLLTALLLPQLIEAGRESGTPSRVVTVSSALHRNARQAPLDDPRRPREDYRRWPEYAESKLANLLFTFELERRARVADLPLVAMAAHPGYAGTRLVANGRLAGTARPFAAILDAASRAVAQSPAQGAWPVLMAATADLPGGSFCGPSGWRELRGPATTVGCSRLARDERAQRRLWELSEATVGVSCP